MPDVGLDSLIGEGGLLAKVGKAGDALNGIVSKAEGWTSLVGGSAVPPAAASAPLSASAGSAAAAPAPSRFLPSLQGVSGVAVAGIAALVALVAWAVWGK